MQLKHLRSFLAVSETNNFRRAARQVGVTQPALSQHVAALEAELGVRLFERDRRRVAITPAGVALRDGARDALALLDRAAELARRFGTASEKTVRVGALDYISHAFLPAAIMAVKRAMPEVLVETHNMAPNEAVRAVIDGEVDVGFGVNKVDAPDLVQREVIRGRWVVWLPEEHPFAKLDEVPLQQLAKEPIILFRRGLNPEAWDMLQQLFLEKGQSPMRVAHQISQPQHGPPLVLQGVGLFFVGSYVLTEKYRGIVSRPVSGFDSQLRIIAAWRSGRRSKALRAFLEGLNRVI